MVTPPSCRGRTCGSIEISIFASLPKARTAFTTESPVRTDCLTAYCLLFGKTGGDQRSTYAFMNNQGFIWSSPSFWGSEEQFFQASHLRFHGETFFDAGLPNLDKIGGESAISQKL